VGVTSPVTGLVIFIVLRMSEATDAEFERDCGLAAQALESIASLVECVSRG
jgi:hypothetical protein